MTAPALVFIPGSVCGPLAWADMAAAMSGGAQCQIIDHRDLDSIGTMADRVLSQAPEKFILCGHSMGGYVALEVARRAPERLLGLVLANTNANADPPGRTARRWQRLAAGPAQFLAGLDRPERYAKSLSPANAGNEAIKARMRQIDADAGYACFVNHQMACMNRGDSLGILPALGMPVLVIAGDDDRVTPLAGQVELARLIPQAQLRVLADCGHLPYLEQPAALLNLLRAFAAPAAGNNNAPPPAGPAALRNAPAP